MTPDKESGAIYREPYPNLRESLYWLYVKYLTDREVPKKSWVQLKCPETGEVFATEYTEAVKKDREVDGGTSICTYKCPECGDHHRFLWGPPAPILLEGGLDE